MYQVDVECAPANKLERFTIPLVFCEQSLVFPEEGKDKGTDDETGYCKSEIFKSVYVIDGREE